MATPRTRRNRRPLKFRQNWKPQLSTVDEVTLEDINQIQLEFNTPILLKGLPEITAYNGASPIAQTVSSAEAVLGPDNTPIRILLTYTGDISAATQIEVPQWDPAIRNSVGGYAAPGFFVTS